MQDQEEPATEAPTLNLEKGESVYSYVLYLPPIIKHQNGHLRNWEMCVGIILLIANFTMQVGLTFIVGQGVIVEGNAWRQTLVGIQVDDQVEEGQVTKDSTQLALFSTGFDKFLSSFDTFEHNTDYLGLNKTQDEQAQKNEDLIHDLKRRLAEKDEEKTSLESGFELQKNRKGNMLMQQSSKHLRASQDAVALAASSKPMTAPDLPYSAAGAATLCEMHNAEYTCFPPTAKYANQWDKLDTNGDGLWSLDEAEKDEAGFENKFKAKPFLVFRAITVGLSDRGAMDPKLWVAPEVKEMKAIPKAYFEYWMGDAILCTYADPYICPTLLQRGFFNEAMNPKNQGKNIQDIDAALDYCVWMLKVGGGCEQSFPQIYKLYRARRQMQCGDGSLYNNGLFKNPHHEVDKVYVAAVDYDSLGKHMKATTSEYQFFLFLVLLLWLYSLLNEIREMFKLAEYCVVAESAGDDGGLEVKKNFLTEEDKEKGIEAVKTAIAEAESGDAETVKKKLSNSIRPLAQKNQYLDDTLHPFGWDGTLFSELENLEDLEIMLERLEDDGDEKYTITGLTSGHRTACAVICAVRVILVIYLGVVGCIFLVMETGYMDLLMNAVALAFILDVDEILFGSIASSVTTDQLEAVEDIEFETHLPTTGCAGWIVQKDFWGMILFPISAMILIACHMLFTTYPVLDALNCACYQTGSQCKDAQNFGKDWWDNYWSVTLPNAVSAIQKLKA